MSPTTNGTLWVSAASTDTPRNMTPRIVLMSTSVVRALRACGFRKMLTPLEMASVPVMAELPLAKARNRKKADTPRMRPPLACPEREGVRVRRLVREVARRLAHQSEHNEQRPC